MEQFVQQLIPEAKWDAVKKALRTAFGTINLETIQPLTEGLSSALVYKILVANKPYVMRIVVNVNELADPARHFTCMKLAADAGIAPTVHYANVEDAISIVDFVEKKPWNETFASREEVLVELAKTIKAIHTTPPFPKLVSFLDAMDGLIAEFRAAGILPESATAEHFRYYAQIQQSYPRHDPDLVSSHNDLNFNNLRFDGEKFWIVDWEAAFLNDRYVDLGNIANGFVRDTQQEEIYLKSYFGDSLDDYKRARFFLMRQICHFFYAMLMFRVAAASKPADYVHDANMKTPRLADLHALIAAGEIAVGSYEGQLLYGKVALNEALHHMKSDRFVESINMMKVVA